jgi:hypothetical protein
MSTAPPPTDPLFIIGTERSGSNLLRLVLDAHPDITVPHPPHVMNYFSHLESRYGDLGDRANRLRLAEDIAHLVAIHIHPWDITPDPARMADEADPPDLFGLFLALYDQHLQHTGLRRWGCKSTFMIHHVDRILARFPRAGLVWLVRDPRDVAVSARKSVFSPCDPRLSARLWAQQQAHGLALEERLPGRVHRLHYEALITDPEPTIRAVCAHLQEDFHPQMLQFSKTDNARKIAKMMDSWKNADAGFLAGNTQKWRRELTDVEVRAVEEECGEVMEALSYPRSTDAGAPIEDPLLYAREARQRAKVEWRSLRTDANHWKRWNRRAWLTLLDLRTRRP